MLHLPVLAREQEAQAPAAVVDDIGPICNRQAGRQIGHTAVEPTKHVRQWYGVTAVADSSSDARRRKLYTFQAYENESHVVSRCAGASHQVHFAMVGKRRFNTERMPCRKIGFALRDREPASLKDDGNAPPNVWRDKR